ncbi:MAG: helix-turn-helix transcriptional regulator [Eggerthellaceae bacterium]|jgi:transcriptional regulator with XRE-family HTH domain|nr:helix-turn-helix transcriptional regulator [Eggerthellaceae bacterium]
MTRAKTKVPGLGKRIREARMAAGLTQQKSADALNMTVRAYQKYEGGDVEPPLQSLVALAIEFNVTTDYLLGLSDEASSDE